MPHGTPDWGVDWSPRTVWGLEDLGEHAVRLGSPHLFDRRGDVLMMTDFRNGLGEVEPYDGVAGGTTGLCTGHSRTGAFSMLLTSDGLTGGAQGARVSLPLPVANRVGCEFSFTIKNALDIWRAQIEWYDGTRWYQAQVQYEMTLQELRYINTLGVWTPFATAVNLWPYDRPAHTMKVVVDCTLQQYVRVIVDSQPYSLVGFGIPDVGAGAITRLIVSAFLGRAIGSNLDLYIDDFIVTQNEP